MRYNLLPPSQGVVIDCWTFHDLLMLIEAPGKVVIHARPLSQKPLRRLGR